MVTSPLDMNTLLLKVILQGPRRMVARAMMVFDLGF
jgi:hypothetical protein